MASPEAENYPSKINILGKEVDPGKVAITGFFLTMAGVWSAFVPSVAVPALVVGLGMMAVGTHGMKQQERSSSK